MVHQYRLAVGLTVQACSEANSTALEQGSQYMQTGLQWAHSIQARSWVRGTYDMIIKLECSNYVTQLVLRCFLVMMIIVAGSMMKRSHKTGFTTRACRAKDLQRPLQKVRLC